VRYILYHIKLREVINFKIKIICAHHINRYNIIFKTLQTEKRKNHQ